MSKQLRESIIHALRLNESRKKVALESLAKDLSDKLSSIKGYSHHNISIVPNLEDTCVDIIFKNTNDSFKVIPQKTKISNENSNKVIKVSSIDGAYIEGTTVYDADGNELGEALIRQKAIHNKSDYSESLDDAEFRFNSKITDLKRLEKYIGREAINNMK